MDKTLPRDEMKEALEAAREFVAQAHTITPYALGMQTQLRVDGLLAKIDAALSSPPEAKGREREVWRHKHRGNDYEIVGEAEVQAPENDGLTDYEVAVVYRNVVTGELWVRRKSEFHERFDRIAAAPSLPPSPPDGTVGELLAKASAALGPFAGCVFNDNGEITTSNRMFTFAEIERAYWAHRRLAAHLRSQAGTVRASCRECNDKGWVYAAEKVPDHQLRKITYFGTRTIKSPCLHCETGRAALAAAPAQEARDK